MALVVLILLPPIFLNIAMALICGLAMYEMLIVTRFVGHRGLVAAAMTFSILSPFLLVLDRGRPAVAAVLVYCIVLVVIQIIYHDSLKVERTGFVFFVSILVPVSISCLAYLRPMSGRGDDRDGLFYVFLAIVMAWLCDIGAYFIGTFSASTSYVPKSVPRRLWRG